MTKLILISGSMAAGKSAVAKELVRLFRERGTQTALTELDEVADMARPTLPSWDWAHEIHAKLVGLWVATGIDVVVDEGTSTVTEVRQVLEAVGSDVDVYRVVIATTYQTALHRVAHDPARGLSKDPAFLRDQYEDFAQHLPQLPCDLFLDSTGPTPTELALEALRAFDRFGHS